MIYQVVKVNTSKHVQSLKDSFSYLPAFITLNNLHGPRNTVNIYVSTYISEFWSNGSLISDLPLTQLTEASTRAGGNHMSGRLFATDLSTASYVGGQGLCTHPLVACPTACPQIFISFWHIAVTEFDFLSVSEPQTRNEEWEGEVLISLEYILVWPWNNCKYFFFQLICCLTYEHSVAYQFI